MKRAIYFFLLVLLINIAHATVLINGTVVGSIGLNTNVTITYPVILQELHITPTTIAFINMSQSTTQTTTDYNISANITVANQSYTGLQLPYVKELTSSIEIISDIDEDLNLTFILYGFNCTDVVFNYSSASNTYDRFYYELDYTCNADDMVLNAVIEKGTNILSFKERKYFFLIDETTNAALNLSQTDSCILYYDDNRTLFNFKTANQTEINFTNLDMNKLRLEIGYSDGTIITRYIDIDLLDTEVRICANHEGVTHYEQLKP